MPLETPPETRVMIELDDIQSVALHPRPSPYVGVYIVLRIDDRRAGRELLRRLIPALAGANTPADPGQEAWVSAALTFQGLKALGVPQDSLDSFPLAFQQGMAARAAELGDVGESAPENWEKPFGSPDVHLASARSRPTRRGSSAYLSAPGRRTRNCQGSAPSGAWIAMRYPPRKKPSGSGTASAIRQSKGAAFPDRTPGSSPSRRASFSWATRTSWENCPRCHGPRSWA